MATQGLRRTLIAVLGIMPAVAVAGPAAQPFTLGKYVPQDFCSINHFVYNPERDAIQAHWARVFEEIKKSGIDTEFKKLIASDMNAADRAEFEQAWDTAAQLVHGVRWGDLIAKEAAFAHRFGAIIPDYVFLCRSSAGSIESNVQGLKAILDTLASLSEDVAVTESTVHGTSVWNLATPKFPLSLHLFNQGEVVGIVTGQRAVNDVLALMAGEKGIVAIVDSPRFKEAAAGLPAPENSLVFVDLQMLLRNMDQMFERMFAQHAGKGREPDQADRVIRKLFDHFDVFDYVMEVSSTDGMRGITTATARLRADAMDKPLCKILTSQKPFEKFDRYLPKEATGFNVSSLLDLQQLYRLILDFIRDEVPEGPAALAKWVEIQKDIDFDIEADLFSWWSGEMVSVSLPATIKGPFTSSDFVLFFRVKDAALADAKVNAGIGRVNAFLREHDQSLMLSDAGDVNAQGFHSVTHPLLAMQGLKLVVGVTDARLVISNSAAAINACLATAAGEVPSIVENERFKKEGLAPQGPVCNASFTDLSNLGQELSSIFFMVGMFGSMLPDQPETRPLKAMISMLGRLSPAIAQIDFLNSSAAVCTFDGQAWTTTQVINYKP